MNELWWLPLAVLLHQAVPQHLAIPSPSEAASRTEDLMVPQETSDRSEKPDFRENELQRGNIVMPSAATMSKTDSPVVEDPISAFLSRLVIIDPSPFLPPDYNSSRKVEPGEENLTQTKETAATGNIAEESVEGVNEKETITESREIKKPTSHSPEGTRNVAIGSLGTLIGNGKHRHTVIESSLADDNLVKVSSVDNNAARQVEDLETKKGSKISSQATLSVPFSSLGITPQNQIVEATTSPVNSESKSGSTSGLKFSQTQGVLKPLTSCVHQCVIIGTLAISSGLEWTDALRHPSSLGFKEVESKVNRALTTALWQAQFAAFLDFVEVAQFVPGRTDPVVLVDVLLQFSDFNVKPTAQLLFQALMENLEEEKLPETDFKVDTSETYFLERSTGQQTGESISCQEDNPDVPRWAWLAITGGLTSFGIIAVTGCIVAMRRFWRSQPAKLSKSSMYSVNKRLDLTSRSRDHLFLGEEDDSRMWGRPSDLFWTLQRQQQQEWPGEEHHPCQFEEQRQHRRKRKDSILGTSYLSHQDESSSCTTDDQGGRVRWQKAGSGQGGEESSGKLHKIASSGSSASESSNARGGRLQLVRTKTMRPGLESDLFHWHGASDEEDFYPGNRTFNLEDGEEGCSDGSSLDI